jgi:hypothetical protein
VPGAGKERSVLESKHDRFLLHPLPRAFPMGREDLGSCNLFIVEESIRRLPRRCLLARLMNGVCGLAGKILSDPPESSLQSPVLPFDPRKLSPGPARIPSAWRSLPPSRSATNP